MPSPRRPGKPVIAEAECYRITRSVAFTRAFAHQGDPKDPVAAAAGTFMLGTKGEVDAAAGDRQGVAKRAMSSLLERLAEARKSGDVGRLAEAIPYAAGCGSRRRTAPASC